MKPQPKELVVRQYGVNPNYLKITASSTDATAWVEREAPQFGVLYRPIDGTRPYYLLEIGDTWDIQEVLAYLAGYPGENKSNV